MRQGRAKCDLGKVAESTQATCRPGLTRMHVLQKSGKNRPGLSRATNLVVKFIVKKPFRLPFFTQWIALALKRIGTTRAKFKERIESHPVQAAFCAHFLRWDRKLLILGTA